MKRNKIYRASVRPLLAIAAVALMCTTMTACSSTETESGSAEQALVPLSNISVGTTANVSKAAMSNSGTTVSRADEEEKFVAIFAVEASFEAHDGSATDKPVSVAYYIGTKGATQHDYLKAPYGGLSQPISDDLKPISKQLLTDAGIATSGTTADGSLLVPAMGEFRLRMHGVMSISVGVTLATYLKEAIQRLETEAAAGYQYCYVWNGKVKMNGSTLVATADDNAPIDPATGKTVDAAGSINTHFPFALVQFNLIGAYGEATTAKPYLDEKFYLSSSTLFEPGYTWTKPTASATGTADLLDTPWKLNTSTTLVVNHDLAICVAGDSHVDEKAANGTRNVLVNIVGQGLTYNGRIYNINVPAGGVTYKAGYRYTYNVKLTESTATIVSVTISDFHDEGSYTIDMTGKGELT